MRLLNLIIFWVIFYYVCGCQPCKENSVCRISYTFKNYQNMPQQYIWRSNGEDVAVCYLLRFSECWVYPQYQNFVKSSIQVESESVTTDVVLPNIDRQAGSVSSERKWELFAFYNNDTLQQLYFCYVKMYNKIEEFHCDYEASGEGVRIKCLSSMVYPQSACEFNVTMDKVPVQIKQDVTYKHTVVHNDPVYYSTECSLLIPKEDILIGLFEYEAAAFPKISNDKTFESRVTFRSKINIEYPEVRLKQCPSTIEEGTEFHCICQREDKSDIHTRIYWDGIKSKAVNHKMTLLTHTASRNKTEFICYATNALLGKSFQKYSPIIINGTDCAREKSCFRNCTTDDAICENNEVYTCHDNKSDILELKIWCLNKSLEEIEAMKSYTCKVACQNVYKVPFHRDKISGSDYTKLVAIISSTSILTGIIVVIVVILLVKRNTRKRSNSDVQIANNSTRPSGDEEENNLSSQNNLLSQ